MLKNMKIKKSLILGFGITIVVSLLIIISTLGLLFNQKNAYTSVIETEMRANELITSIRLDATVHQQHSERPGCENQGTA